MNVKIYAVLLAFVATNFSATRVPDEVPAVEISCFKEITTVQSPDNAFMSYLRIPCIYNEGWDTLAEVKFWRKVITLEKDSSLANVHGTRQILRAVPRSVIDSLELRGKLDLLRAEMCTEYGLPENTRIKFTAGKKWFYQNYDGINGKMARAINLFDSFGTDPFYAQSVLLIESPGSNKAKSSSGAYGHFQLMPYVARQFGLRVDKYVDERTNFERSAYAAARLFRDVCVPYARKWCDQYGFKVDESALWFKLLVLHCYNAGASTVRSAMQYVPNSLQGNDLIKTLWHTNYGRFQTESQNYSQIALACYLEFEKSVEPYSLVSSVVYQKF